LECALQLKIAKKSIKPPYYEISESFKIIDVDVDTTKKLVTMLVVIGSMPMVICNSFHWLTTVK